MSLIESFVHNRKGKTWVPLDVLDMGQFRMAIYQGDITEFDIVIKSSENRRKLVTHSHPQAHTLDC